MHRSSFLRALLPTALLASLLLAACGGSAAVTPLPSGAPPPADCARVDASGVISISAKDLQFSAPCMVAEADTPFVIRFTNEEAVPHDVAVYRDSSKSNEIMRGEIITGPNKDVDYQVQALAEGDYYFNCTVHPAMDGSLYVIASG